LQREIESLVPSDAGARRPRVAIIGSVGIPNRYGGPEAFAESIAPALLERGYEVTVTCDPSRYRDDLSRDFRGVRRIFIDVNANGASSMLHDFLAFFAVFWRAEYVLVLGVSGGLFFPLFRMMCALARCRLLVNIDGVEWRRAKWSGFGKLVLYLSDWLAQQCAHVIIYDNDALLEYVLRPAKAACVEYIGDHAVFAHPPRDPRSVARADVHALTICRIEPENNCHVLIEGFLKSRAPSYVFLGNWQRSEYGRELVRKYANESRLKLLDPIYDPEEVYALRGACVRYLHGHSVGGTNPSLAEILYFDCAIYCWDCSFNRATAGEAASYFNGADELAALLDAPAPAPRDRARVRNRYSTKAIVSKLIDAFGVGRKRGKRPDPSV
jgi:glycosyltransferase involved in cell wall biosynthesis